MKLETAIKTKEKLYHKSTAIGNVVLYLTRTLFKTITVQSSTDTLVL